MDGTYRRLMAYVRYFAGLGRNLENGPETYETPVPVEALCRQMQQEGFEIEPSQDAGAYVCNDTFYLTGLRSPAPVSFIHVPAQPDQAEAYARTVARVIELAIEAIQG